MQPVVISARMVMVVPVVDGSLSQATRETCSPVQLQQLLQHDVYPEDDAAALAAQARADQAHALQRNLVIGGVLGAALVCIFVVWKRRQ
jgi:hypothetical protein